MTNSYFRGLDLTISSYDILFVGTSAGATRINTNASTSADYTTENSLIYGLSNNVININSGNVITIVTGGTGDSITYLDYGNSIINRIDDETFTRTYGTVNSKAYIYNSYGGVVNETGIVSILNKNTNIVVRGIRVINDDSYVNFGEDGSLESYTLPESFVGVLSSPQEILIKNDGHQIANANVLISYTGAISDSYIKVASSYSGTYYGIRENAVKQPRDIPWENGYFYNTQVVGNSVTISGNTGPYYYISPVIDTTLSSVFSSSRVFWVSDEPGLSSIDFPDIINGQKSIMIRQSSVPPSGSWSSGSLADEDDILWSTISGSLTYSPVTNYSIDSANYRYAQLKVNFVPDIKRGFILGTNLNGGFIYAESGVGDDVPYLNELGLEIPTRVFGIYPSQTGSVFIRSDIPVPASGQRIRNLIRHTYLDTWWDFE